MDCLSVLHKSLVLSLTYASGISKFHEWLDMKYLADDFVLCQKLTLVLHCHLNHPYSCDLQNAAVLEALPLPVVDYHPLFGCVRYICLIQLLLYHT